MQRLQAFKYELIPNGEQQRDMRRFAGSCRFVYNKALALQKATYEAGGKFIGYVAMAKHLTEWRNGTETPWLKETRCSMPLKIWSGRTKTSLPSVPCCRASSAKAQVRAFAIPMPSSSK